MYFNHSTVLSNRGWDTVAVVDGGPELGEQLLIDNSATQVNQMT